MNLVIAIASVVAIVVIAEVGRKLVAKLFSYPPERHAIPIMKLPGTRGTTGFRLALILAGPVTGYLAIAGLAFALFRCHGMPSSDGSTEIREVVAGSDAVTKLAPGDDLLEIDGNTFAGGSQELSSQINARRGTPVLIAYERAGVKGSATITPTQRDGRWLLGVQLAPKLERGTVKAMRAAILYPARQAANTFRDLLRIVMAEDDFEAGGPVRIVAELEPTTAESTGVQVGLSFGVYAVMALALFDLFRALFLILFRT